MLGEDEEVVVSLLFELKDGEVEPLLVLELLLFEAFNPYEGRLPMLEPPLETKRDFKDFNSVCRSVKEAV